MPYPFYNNYQNYNHVFYPQQYQNMQQSQQPIPQIQNGGFVMVKDISEAMTYPVAPGNSVTFKDENKPYIYTKTLGFSQLDQPIFEVFKLVKEEKEPVDNTIPEVIPEDKPVIEYFTMNDAEILKAEMDGIKEDVDFLKAYINESKESEE